MKVLFTGSVSEKDKYLNNYKRIIEYLESKGHKVIADHILSSDEKTINSSAREDILKFHSQLEDWIVQCDFIIAETSYPSISVGYEISLALRLGKPVLILYSEGGPPSIFTHYKAERLVTEKYDFNNYKQIIDDFIRFVEEQSDLRFTFYISPQIALFLDEISKKERIPKSVYLRKLIERDIPNHSLD